jgi:hypothetical protein
MLLPANLPQRLLAQLIISHNITWGLAGIMGDSELSPLLSPVCISQNSGRRFYQVPTDSLIQRGEFILLASWVRASDTQRNPLRHRKQLRSTAVHTGKNLALNSGLLQEAKVEIDHPQ